MKPYDYNYTQLLLRNCINLYVNEIFAFKIYCLLDSNIFAQLKSPYDPIQSN